jgi:hypothetical protein
MKNLILILIVFSLSACSRNIIVEREPNVAIEAYKTYAWNVLEVSKDVNPFYNNDLLNRQLMLAIDDNLYRKGVRQVTENPDFLIDFHIYVVEQHFQDYYCPQGYYRGYRLNYEILPWPACEIPIRNATFDDGTLFIDVVDAHTKQLVWRGSYNNLINDRSQIKGIFMKRVGKILEKLPIDNLKKLEIKKVNSKTLSRS